MEYTISQQQPHLRYIQVKAVINDIEDGLLKIQLPAWRPGRYELANFAKNIRNFSVVDEKGSKLPFNKVTKDQWDILTLDSKSVIIQYEYYANTLDAGSTYTDEKVLYVNPVNCLVYEPKKMHEACSLILEIPDSYTIACSLPKTGKTLYAENFDELADSPVIASNSLQHTSFSFGESTHHIWINGENTLDIESFAKEVEQYTQEQVAIFNHFPAKDFHYLIHFLPYRYRHGVEHKNSTVIVHGPGNEFNQITNKNDLLAICSHELFHFWNIKRIRPAAMLPYDFTKENYSTLGFVYEGVTTYYGDYMLLRSGVMDFDTYSVEISKDLQRHFSNGGRYNYSVAESSFDTWLDGYSLGAPDRKVSIYVEGMLAALIIDIEIRKLTNNNKSLDTVMQLLYQRFYLNNKGYSEQDYKLIIEEVCEQNMDKYFEEIIWGKGEVEKQLPEVLSLIGLEIKKENSDLLHEDLFGFKTALVNDTIVVTYCAEDSPADAARLGINDTLLSINNKPLTAINTLEEEIKNNPKEIVLKTQSLFKEQEIVLSNNGRHYHKKYSLIKMLNVSEQQEQFFKLWSKQDF